jgi:hypothetical protein
MSLSDFISHRDKCPFCDTSLVTFFHSTRKQSIRYEDHRMLAIFDMNGLNKSEVSYKVGYSLNMNDNSFQIEFFTDHNGMYFNAVTLGMLEKFKEFHRNLGGRYSISRKCTFCKKYSYSSQRFGINFKTQQTEDISAAHESFSFVLPTEEDCKIIILSNKYFSLTVFPPPMSEVHFWRGSPSDAAYDRPYPSRRQLLTLPFIPFVSVEATSKRLNGLLNFS